MRRVRDSGVALVLMAICIVVFATGASAAPRPINGKGPSAGTGGSVIPFLPPLKCVYVTQSFDVTGTNTYDQHGVIGNN